MKMTLALIGGPLDGQSFFAELAWPPPERIAGVDIHHDLCGTYERCADWKMADRQEPELSYELRADKDYLRVERGWNRYRVARAVAGLASKLRP